MLPLRKAVLFLGRAYLLLFHHDLAILILATVIVSRSLVTNCSESS